jgi:hypothetical protein
MLTSNRPQVTRRLLALVITIALPVLCLMPRPTATHASTILFAARFLNNSSYPIVQLVVDHQQIVPGQAAAIPPQSELTINLPLGNHSYSAANGLNAGFTMYTFSGTFNLRLENPLTSAAFQTITILGVTHKLESHAAVFTDPTIAQLLTRFGAGGSWSAQFFDDNGIPHLNTFTFRANGTYVFSVDGRQLGGNNYTLVSRDPGTQTVTFNVGGTLNSVFMETQGVFFMKNDPHGNALEYLS